MRFDNVSDLGSPTAGLTVVIYAERLSDGATVSSTAEAILISNLSPTSLTTLLTLSGSGDWRFKLKAYKASTTQTASSGTITLVAMGTKK
jgi:hypothetical protein